MFKLKGKAFEAFKAQNINFSENMFKCCIMDDILVD